MLVEEFDIVGVRQATGLLLELGAVEELQHHVHRQVDLDAAGEPCPRA